jgi:hypothetical protein
MWNTFPNATALVSLVGKYKDGPKLILEGYFTTAYHSTVRRLMMAPKEVGSFMV